MKALLTNNLIKNFANRILNKNINFGFSQMISYNTNNLYFANNLNYNLNKESLSELNLENKNNDIHWETNIVKVELKNKTRKVAERKRKKRKTGKDIKIRWR